MDQNFEVIFRYRETDAKTIPFDEELIVVALQSLGVQPTASDSNGRKIRVHFLTSEIEPHFSNIQKSMAGINVPGLAFDLNKMILAFAGWKNIMTYLHARKSS